MGTRQTNSTTSWSSSGTLRLQAGRHARAIHFHEDVIRQVGPRVDEHRPRDRSRRTVATARSVSPVRGGCAPTTTRSSSAQKRHLADVEVVTILRAQEIPHRMELRAERRRLKATRQKRSAEARRRVPRPNRDAVHHARRSRANRPRDPGKFPPQSAAPVIPVVAAQQLVAAVAREADGHVLPGQPRQQQRRDLRRVGERLVPDRRAARGSSPAPRPG